MFNNKKELTNADDQEKIEKRIIQIKGKHYALMGLIYFSISGICLAKINSQIDVLINNVEEIQSDLEDISNSLEEIDQQLEKIEQKLEEADQDLEEIKQRLQEPEEHVDLSKDLGKDSVEYLQMCNNLLEVREKLNISSEEDQQYANIPSIGDYVNLVDEDSPIYEDIYSVDRQENATTSLYGTGEIRCIQSIIMSNQEMVTEVDNMDDYELFKNIGFEVKGYNLVNQFSLAEDDSLTTEFRCEKDAIKLEKRMNTRPRR